MIISLIIYLVYATNQYVCLEEIEKKFFRINYSLFYGEISIVEANQILANFLDA